MRLTVLTVLAALVALAAALVALAASGPTSTASTASHYHLQPGDTVVVDGNRIQWSCTFTMAGPFECRGPAEWTRPKPHLLLRVVVFQDGLFVQRGHKTVYGVNR